MPKRIPGDPLTGVLPVTRLIVPQALYGPVRQPRSKPQTAWPILPDPLAISYDQMVPGRVAYVRTRRGIRRYLIRVVNKSREPGKNRGRHYVIGHDRKGWCHKAWADQVVRIESVQQAIVTGRVLRAIRTRSRR
jgi:hypothetical protein